MGRKSKGFVRPPTFPLGSMVKVTNPKSWLHNQIGVVRPQSMLLRKNLASMVAEKRPISLVIDFCDYKEGWIQDLTGVRKTKTHNCQGSLERDTGYLMQEYEIEIVDKVRLH